MIQRVDIFAALVALFASQTVFAGATIENSAWQEIFDHYSVTGVFVLCKNTSASCTTNDSVRANQTFIPASTFKIANALIALETGILSDGQQVLKWDKRPRALKIWEQDFTLRGAIQVSAVPIFQEFAREIGESRMQYFVKTFNYGNAQIGGGIENFWLDGDLRISAVEQIEFLESLYHGEIPVSERNQLIVKDALTSEATPSHLVRSKTGYSGINQKITPGVAWWVGWIEIATDVYYFAFNMDVHEESSLPARKTIPIKLLQTAGIQIDG